MSFETRKTTYICEDCHVPFEGEGFFTDGVPRFVSQACEPCIGIRLQKQRDAAMEAHRKARELRWAELCPLEYRLPSECGGHTDLARLDVAQPGWQKLLDYKLGPRGLLIRGPTGRGKTRVTWRLLRMLWDQGQRISALTAGELDRQCRDAAGNFTLNSWFKRLATADVFFLDDLGKGHWTQATEAHFFDLVDERTRKGKPILVTTNDSGETLAARLSDDRAEPLIRRLRDYCECVNFE